MALIDTTTLLGIADRAAQQYNILNTAFPQANQEGGGFYFTRVTATNDPDIEIPLDGPYEAVDQDLLVDFAIKNGSRMGSSFPGNSDYQVDRLLGFPVTSRLWVRPACSYYAQDKEKLI